MSKLVVAMRDIQRYKILEEVIEKKLTAQEASELLSLSYRHILRLKDKVREECPRRDACADGFISTQMA